MVSKFQYKKALGYIYLINALFFVVTVGIPIMIIALNHSLFITCISILALYSIYAFLLIILGVTWIEKPVKKNEIIVREYRRQV